MAQFFTRFLKGMVEDVVVEKLSNNKAFQNMAVSAMKSKEAAQAAVEEGMRDPGKVTESATSFFSALKAEIAKDFAKMSGEAPQTGEPAAKRKLQ